MPKNQVSDLITDQEIAFARLILSGTMTDRQAAEAVGLNPDTAAYTKAKPRVVAFMHEHRAAVRERLVQQEADQLRRQNQSRDQVLARLWDIANLDPELTRNSASAQIKALAMIVAIEGLIPSRTTNDRRAVSAQNKSGPPLSPDFVCDEDGPGVPDLPPGAAADAPSDPGPTPGPTSDSSEPILVHPFLPLETTPAAPNARVPTSASDNRLLSSIEKKPDAWRL